MNRANVIGPSSRDLVPDQRLQRRVAGDGVEVRERDRGGGRPSLTLARRPGAPAGMPGPDERVAAEHDRDRRASRAAAVSSRSHGSAIRSGSSRSDANRSSAAGQPRSSAPRRWASNTRVSISAPSPSCRDAARPSDSGPARSSASPRTDARRATSRPGRPTRRRVATPAAPAPRPGRARAPRWPLEPRQRGARRSARRRQLGAGVTGDDRDRASAADDGRVASRRHAHRPARRAPRSNTRSSGYVDIDRESPAGARSRTGTPACSASQRGSALSDGRSGTPARTSRAARPPRLRRVAIVRERTPLVGCGGSHDGRAVGGGRQRDRARAEHDEPAVALARHEPRGAASRTAGRRAAPATIRPPLPRRPRTPHGPLRDARRSAASQLQRSRRRPGLGVEDDDAGRSHEPSLASGGP